MEIELVSSKMRGRGRGRGRGARGRRGAVARGRPKKNVKVLESDEEDCTEAVQEVQDENFPPSQTSSQVTVDLEADISKLEAPTFTTLNRGPPEPMLRLRWDHKVSLIGEKVLNPMIHSCDQCLKPILIYGRMIPCKHVFCLSCARREEKCCPRCMEPVSRVEQTGLGTVFMCTHGGSRYGNNGCRRTYLSQRDLQAHINHRHAVPGEEAPKTVPCVTIPTPAQIPAQTIQPRKLSGGSNQNDPRGDSAGGLAYRTQPRSNLITVPIQQDSPLSTPPAPPTQYHQAVGGSPGYGMGYGAAGVPGAGAYGVAGAGAAGGYYQPQPPQFPPGYPPTELPPGAAQPSPYWPPHPLPPHTFFR